MHFNFLILFSLVLFLSGGESHNISAIRDAAWPYDIKTPFCYRTPSPINIDTSEVKFANPLTKIKLKVGLFELHSLTNTGCSVRVTVCKNVLTSLTGGPLGIDEYVFQEISYYWSPNCKSSVANDIDGVGSPLFIKVTFRNRKYPNANIAIGHRDGFAVILVNVQVEGYVPNPCFEAFGKALKCIKKAGSTIQAVSLPLFIWFDQLPMNFYYAYPGSVELFGSSVSYDCATVFQLPKSGSMYISIPQFQNFLDLRDALGNPIANRVSVFHTGGRPVAQICGISQEFIPTAV